MDTPRRHHIYEINTATYLQNLSRRYGRTITLSSIPDEEIENIARYGADIVWLMGIWQRSSSAAEIARQQEPLVHAAQTLLPDYSPDDIIGSAYAIYDYRIDERFGDDAQLRDFRARLKARGISLLLDFVPNHTAFDHPWIREDPTRYIQGSPDELSNQPTWFSQAGGMIVAHGRDPHFEPWTDVAQLNAFSPSYRSASIDTLTRIASMCDGVRCDMAMLLLNGIFAQTWGERAGPMPSAEYWREVIDAVRQQSADFIFIAECYWQTEATLIEQGFDFCYDKTWHDVLLGDDTRAIINHLLATTPIADHLVRFLENHDERRAAELFAPERHKAAAFLTAATSSATMWYRGQFIGYPFTIPVQLGREPETPPNQTLADYYQKLLVEKQQYAADWRLHPGDGRILVGEPIGNPSATILINYSAEDAFFAAESLRDDNPRMISVTHDDSMTGHLRPWEVIILERQ